MFGRPKPAAIESSTKDPEELDLIKEHGRELPKRYEGWRRAVLLCATFTSSVLVVNVSIMIWAVATHGWGGKDGRQVLYKGSCKQASRLNTSLHFGINALSTVILSSSSYCMQCLSAPTRSEVNQAHAGGKWLDIGILSVRNLRAITKKRFILWFIFALSTVPIHWFYNSTIFNSIAITSYTPISVKPDFVQSPIRKDFSIRKVHGDVDAEAYRLKDLHSQNKLERLENIDCIQAYIRPFQTQGSVLLVTEKQPLMISPMVAQGGVVVSNNAWVCNATTAPCNDNGELRKIEPTWIWAIKRDYGGLGYPIRYCLSEKLPEQCKLHSNAYLSLITIVINTAAATIMLALVVRAGDDPLLNIGDAISSFLQNADTTTEGMCLASKDDFKGEGSLWQKLPKKHKSQHRRLFLSISKSRWLLCLVLYVPAIGIVFYLLTSSAMHITMRMQLGFSTIWKLGIGRISPYTILSTKAPRTGAAGLIANSLIANSGQTILSPLYFAYNGLFTLMSLADEWESYGQHRKGLRVSSKPSGQQRSYYFLQLPYRLLIPLLVLSGFVQWLISQSIFLVSIEEWTYNPASSRWEAAIAPSTSLTRVTCGYSPLAMILLIITAALMLFVLMWKGFRPMKTDMPIVSSCSAAIAAACHVEEKEDGLGTSLSEVQWGVTTSSEVGFGHCAFSKFPVTPLQENKMYM